jgi:hypothetical protein
MIGAVALVSLSLGGCFTTATGQKVGTVVKFAQEGAISMTWEGELIRGGLSAGTGAQGRAFDFTVEDPALIEVIRNAMVHNKEIEISYHREAFAAPWRTETKENYFVDSVKVLGDTPTVTVPGATPDGLAPTSPVSGVTREQAEQINESLKGIRASIDALAQAIIAQKR